MSQHRVVITGVGLTSPLGNALDAISRSLQENRSGVRVLPQFGQYDGLKTRVGAPVEVDLEILPKKKTRTMGRVALLSTWATQQAIADSGLDAAYLSSGKVGVAYGSTGPSSGAVEDYVRKLLVNKSLGGIQSATYPKLMSHTCAANLAVYFGLRGRVIPTCAACVSSSMAIGYAFETVRNGTHEAMVCGGAEELDVIHVSVFDVMFATSTRWNERPSETPRPFDAERDGLVVGEGAGTLVLESYDRARARGARIYAEIIGFGTNCDGYHMTAPTAEGMGIAMSLCLESARIAPSEIDYVNAHATATDIGDVCESQATHKVVGTKAPVASTKGFTGHTLGACGVIESVFCLAMMRDGFLAPNRNLEKVHPDCAPLNYVVGPARRASPRTIMNNNFAFGGVNTSLLFRAV
jgi:3-oxoacyl-[acyl-carrier-protein] synthase II